ncbi:nuclear transport factor 2 family protein [Levilactobacillus zymae]|uniref:nuclear transport factor 2 family protein n=1 Tax=Levilactobacillus zymae TaxID=267363 RepID=UPI0028BA2CC4|nr:nuclear transport factor 2 family protein [Levilactobacillus zymae]MDT6981133.1 nuclear transport factor 2 family protein [Levilactobacillus zymae]
MTYGEAESNLILDRLVNQWAVLGDERKIDQQLDLMAASGTYRVTRQDTVVAEATGRPALKALFTQQAQAADTVFTLNGPHLITLNADENTASGVLYAQVKVVKDQVLTDYSVRYDDQYAFIDHNWAIQERQVHLLIEDAHPLA